MEQVIGIAWVERGKVIKQSLSLLLIHRLLQRILIHLGAHRLPVRRWQHGKTCRLRLCFECLLLLLVFDAALSHRVVVVAAALQDGIGVLRRGARLWLLRAEQCLHFRAFRGRDAERREVGWDGRGHGQ